MMTGASHSQTSELYMGVNIFTAGGNCNEKNAYALFYLFNS